MKFVIFAGTPGCGKTSIIKHVIDCLKDLKLVFVKFDCLTTDDEKIISAKFNIPSFKKLSGDLCPDHYSALSFPKIISQYQNKDVILIETAGLCLRCSPYVYQGLGINILDITAGNPDRYGPILTDADIVAISKGDLISQAEREIFRTKVFEVNKKTKIIEVNGLTGEGSLDLADLIRETPDVKEKLVLKHNMPSAICGYCYGNKIIDEQSVKRRYLKGKKIKNIIPNLNCGRCGFKSCNEFIRAVLDGKADIGKCPYIKKTRRE